MRSVGVRVGVNWRSLGYEVCLRFFLFYFYIPIFSRASISYLATQIRVKNIA